MGWEKITTLIHSTESASFSDSIQQDYMDKKIKKIAHLADIHIRKLHRFVEYRDVFDRLYKNLRKLKPDLIYIGGMLYMENLTHHLKRLDCC